jgi:diketogulonate reductase-like aldo/keto reductase
VPQLCIRYTLQLGAASLPKTANPEHMRSNAEVDFVITDEDMSTLRELRAQDYGQHSAFPVYSGK